MKKVARMRLSSNSEEMAHNQHSSSHSSNSEPIVRTTGRIKKPKAVFDPSDNYLPRAQRPLVAGTTSYQTSFATSLERRASYTKASTVSPIGSTESKDACTVCNKKISKRPQFANKNPLIPCQECQRKIHKQCLRFDFEDFENFQSNYKCDQCSTCRICNDKFRNDEDEIITCSKCTKSFHLICFPTKVVSSIDNMRTWKCNKCQVYNQITNGNILPVTKIREIIGDGEPSIQINTDKIVNSITEKYKAENSSPEAKPSTTCSSTQKRVSTEKISTEDTKIEKSNNNEPDSPPEKRKKESNQYPDTLSSETESVNTITKSESTALCFTPNENFDDIPDVKEWSVEQVYEYFNKHFPKEAHVFKNEEIDGRSLLLLKRSDVVKKLPIKLGPSLRIYSLILKIQAQLNDSTLGWNCGL